MKVTTRIKSVSEI